MLPLAPVLSSQVAPLLQSALQESLHVPVQLSDPRQWNEQLPPSSLQPVSMLAIQVQLAFSEQVQLEPEQAQSGPGHSLAPSQEIASAAAPTSTNSHPVRAFIGPTFRDADVARIVEVMNMSRAVRGKGGIFVAS